MSTIARFKFLGLAAIPLALVLVTVLAFTLGSSSSSTEAATSADDCPTAGILCMTLDAPSNAVIGANFKVTVRGFSDGSDIGGFATEIVLEDGLSYTAKSCQAESQLEPENAGTNCVGPTVLNQPPAGTTIRHGANTTPLTTVPRTAATSIDPLLSLPNVQCTEKGTFQITLTAKSAVRPAGAVFTDLDDNDLTIKSPGTKAMDFSDDSVDNPVDTPIAETVSVTCENATATPTRTQTSTPTNTPTATNTPAAPPIFKSPDLQNLWLTRQGTKIPSATCESGNDVASFQVGTDTAVTGVDPKNPPKIQDVGAFEFEVHFDDQKVCVDIEPGFDANKMSCFVDGVEGVARIGCVTLGKPVIADGVWAVLLTNAAPPLLGDANCTLIIANNVAIDALAIPAVKGNQVATGAVEPACTGGTDEFGWVASPFLGGGYDNSTNELSAIIPCLEPKTSVCETNGVVTGTFSENAFEGSGTIGLGDPNDANPPVPITFDIIGTRVGRIPVDDLATVTVRPQPDVYSQAKPNQDNGVVVQLNNQKCELADLQGHAINVFSCDDGDVTIRFLEGDVEPDCEVDTLDTQGIAFRWGANKGSLFYLERFNLEPSGTQSDDDIDIKDLQFVYGRFGSTCDEPHPTQNPVNPKA